MLVASTSIIAQPSEVTGLVVTAYDHHVELNWDAHPNPTIQGFRIYGAVGDSEFTFLGFQNTVKNNFIHFLGDWGATGQYYVQAVGSNGQTSAPSDTISGTTFQMSDSALLDMVQEYTFRYFWDFGHPVSGMARERNTTSTVTSGGSGFGIMAIIVGVERGFITYEQALERMSKIVDFLIDAPKFKGAFAHWMNGATGQVVPFSQLDNGGDLVETAFLIQGLLTARQYYAGDGPEEEALRDKITQIWEDVDWNWYRKLVDNVLFWHWSPDNEFAINLPIRGFNETHIIYLLAIASPVPSHNIPPSLYHNGWAGGNYINGQNYYGFPLEVGSNRGGPLFFSHYSYLGFDPRGIADEYTNYFVRNTYHSLINNAHCVENPFNREGYSDLVWGITASDDPDGYLAHSPVNANLDNGTIAPTAALSSMPYTPELSMRTLKHFYRELGDRLWGEYGFYDAFNLERNWFADSYLAIDQGPIICMIENYRTGLLWDLFMANPELTPALEAIGFVPDSSVVNSTNELPAVFSTVPGIYPNPARERIQVSFQLKEAKRLNFQLLDFAGRPTGSPLMQWPFTAGEHQFPLPIAPGTPGGYYWLQLSGTGFSYVLPLVIVDN
ncbi:MAG: glucoamylase family protein [Bacteroidota bacterium]